MKTMKRNNSLRLTAVALQLLVASPAAIQAHSWKAGNGVLDKEALREHLLADWQAKQSHSPVPGESGPVLVASTGPVSQLALAAVQSAAQAPAQSSAFQNFPKLQLRWDADYLYIGSNGLPDHNMMVGITAWQQQVPLPQAYFGDNAWRLPLHPIAAKVPQKVENHFLRGAIALAVNGIPIFNPQNNRGEISYEIGELDQWGGHCGRADDYHYHIAPLHLQSVAGKGMPIAFALDGYPIYGLSEPDGSPLRALDECHGHEDSRLGYHYHASTKRPYLQSAFHGEVVEAEEQVNPQPHAQPVREALPSLRGAKITGFKTSADGSTRFLSYTVNGRHGEVNFTPAGDKQWRFQFVSTDGTKTEQTYQAREGGGGGQGRRPGPDGDAGRPPRDGKRPPPRENGQPPRRDEGPGGVSAAPSKFGPDALKKPVPAFDLTSPVVTNGGDLPVEFTGDGEAATLPLKWKGAPAGTRSYALIMDHQAPGNEMKWYWTMWDIPATASSLPKNVQGVGKVGTGFKGRIGYEPPHSKGPGAKTYVLTLYALSQPLSLSLPPQQVNREVLMEAMKDKVLASASLSVVHTSKGEGGEEQRPPRGEDDNGGGRPRPGADRDAGAMLQPPDKDSAERQKKGGDNKGLIKPTTADTVHVDVYADNWFAMFINGELVAVDSIKFTPHNVQSFDILPEYPMTIAILAKDNADGNTGMEYGDHVGDGGFIVKFSDGTPSNAKWKAMNFFKGPLNRDTKNPKVIHTPLPEGWWKIGFDDRQWPFAMEYTEERVNPKEPFYKADFSGAKFIWSEDLDLDNTVILRTVIDKPGWKPRWNTKPDIDISGAPYK